MRIVKYLNLSGKRISSKEIKNITSAFKYPKNTKIQIIRIKIPPHFNIDLAEEFSNTVIVTLKKKNIFGVIFSEITNPLLTYAIGLKYLKCENPKTILCLNSFEKNGFKFVFPGWLITPEQELDRLKIEFQNKNYSRSRLKAIKKRMALLEIKDV